MRADHLYDRLRSIAERHGSFATGTHHLNLVGVRGWLDGKKVTNAKDAYNDTIYVLYVDADGTRCVEAFRASVEPGRFEKKLNPEGDAHLCDGRYEFRRGLQQGRYPALVQASPVKVWRDADKSGSQDETEHRIHTGYYGINIHYAGTTDRVGMWSAGCQVIWGGANGPWTRLMALVDRSPQQTFPYTLVDGYALEHGDG